VSPLAVLLLIVSHSPPQKQVLYYLLDYVERTPKDIQMPIHQVCAHQRQGFNTHATIWNQVLAKLVAGTTDSIPDPSLVLPYIGLYSMVHLKPDELEELILVIPVFPHLSILRDNQWVPPPSEATPATQHVARIFDARSLPARGFDISLSFVPLYAGHPQFRETRYWRLPKATLEGVLSAVMLRAVVGPTIGDELLIAKALYGWLIYQQWKAELPADRVEADRLGRVEVDQRGRVAAVDRVVEPRANGRANGNEGTQALSALPERKLQVRLMTLSPQEASQT
jgi:hypothetical protein